MACMFLFPLLVPAPGYSMGQQKGKTEELKFWHSIGTHNKDVMIKMISSYNSSRKQTTVRGVFEGSEEDLYLKLLSRENLPDLILIPIHLLPGLIEEKLLAELSSYIPQKTREDIAGKYWESVTMDEGIYGVPFSFSSQILYVNQHILRIAGARNVGEPSTWEKISPIISKIRDNTEGKWALFIPMETAIHFISFVESFTGESIFQDRRLTVNGEKTIAAMTYLQELAYLRSLMPPKITMAEGEQLFLSGNLGLMAASSSILVYMQSNLPYSLTVWHLPSSGAVKPLITGSCLAIIKSNTRREREAFDFIEYLLSYENAIKWHTHTGNPAIRTGVKKSLDLLVFYEENPNYTTPVIDLERGKIFNPRIDYVALNKIVKKALEKIMINREDPAKVLTGTQAEIDTLWMAAQSK